MANVETDISTNLYYFIYDIQLANLGYFVSRKYIEFFKTLCSPEKGIEYTGRVTNEDGTIGLLFTVTASEEKDAEEKLKSFMTDIHQKNPKLCSYV